MVKRNFIWAVALSDSASPEGASWAILVQPKQTKTWFRHDVHPKSTVFEAHGRYNDVRSSAMLVKALIGENEVSSVDKAVEHTLRDLPVSASVTWVSAAIAALQTEGLISKFEVGRFMGTAQKVLMGVRREKHATDVAAEIDHEGNDLSEETRLALGKGEKEKERKKGGMWISYGPNVEMGLPRQPKARNSWERQDDAYGGLM